MTVWLVSLQNCVFELEFLKQSIEIEMFRKEAPHGDYLYESPN